MRSARPMARLVWYGLLKTASSCSALYQYPIHCKENMTDAISICVDAVALSVTANDNLPAQTGRQTYSGPFMPIHLRCIGPAIRDQCWMDHARWHEFG
jgi:hypothetical protein